MKLSLDSVNFRKYLEDWEYHSSLSSSLEHKTVLPASLAENKKRLSKDSFHTDDSKGTIETGSQGRISNMMRPSNIKKRVKIEQDDSNLYMYDNKRHQDSA